MQPDPQETATAQPDDQVQLDSGGDGVAEEAARQEAAAEVEAAADEVEELGFLFVGIEAKGPDMGGTLNV